MNSPLISVIVPCYNQSEFLNECLQSIMNQSYSNWECMMVNDGSTDVTEDLCKVWEQKDKRFKYFYKKNGGLSSARNYGLEKSNGDWIQFLDCDDFIHPEKFQKSVLLIDDHCKLVVSNFKMFYENSLSPPFSDIMQYPINVENLILRWDVDFNIPIHCPIFKKTSIVNIHFNEQLKAKEDWVFWIDLFKQENISYQLINDYLAYYRHNPNSLSKNFKLVYENIRFANRYIYKNNDVSIKNLLFEKLNNTIFLLNNNNLDQKNYIRQLQNTKVLKYYFFLKRLLK
ncbi:glycosyltransferase family 2 protein [Kaistella antarctica]|uniref:Hyaluronan synthase n=1 Tax=Kaistella antarctica TaxID=266748 RepID=A0A3S4UYU6_9FLAO|nr:glycosyltransferase family 2 protein [Kaistella antarctica]SEV79872.1 Glycosyltransferase involved in cell wall bisynthesis [Kaistella antarctica]VEH99958.1 Hyaluronan synthase [Kaistella antarctica]